MNTIRMKTFTLYRMRDISGTSGTGTVAEGVQFSDGTCVIRWLTLKASTAVYNSIEDIESIHGHNGATVVLWKG